MALIVEDGTGLSTAESYVSVAEADAYLAKFGLPDAWNLSTEEQKEQALRQATRYVDARFHGRWKGWRSVDDQALDWPRSDVSDSDGFLIDSDEIPTLLKSATIELANRARSATLMPDIDEPGTIKSTRVRVGPIEDETVYVGGKSQTKKFVLVDNLLKDYVDPIGMVERA